MDESERSRRRRQTEPYRTYQRAYQRAYYHRRKEQAIAYRNSPERREYMKTYQAANHAKLDMQRQESARLKLYGLTQEQYRTLLEKQDWECPICTRLLTKPVVDHEHGTSRVRGLLCRNCNAALGLLEDNTDNLERAIEYLIRSLSGAISTRSSEP